MCPSSHSKGSRTSMTTRSGRSSFMVARSCTLICGTVATGRPWPFHSVMPHCSVPATASRPMRPSPCTARSRSVGLATTSTTGASGVAKRPARFANCGLSIHTLIAPGMWPWPYSSGERTSRTHAPFSIASRTCAADRGRGLPLTGTAWARLRAMIRSKLGGLGGRPVIRRRTKSSTPAACSAALKRRSKPMVVAVLLDIARPQLDPAPCAG